MVYELSEEKRLILSNIEEFAKRKVEPISKKVDEEDHIPEELYVEMKDHGLLSLIIPQEYGGLGLDTITYSKVLEIFGRYSGGIALSLEAHNSLGLNHVFLFGSEHMKKMVIDYTLKNSRPVAWALTEPSSGTDAKNMSTTYRKEGNRYFINGSKIFITHGASAKYIVVMAKGENGINAFLVDGDSLGLERNKIMNKMGVRGSDTAEIVFNNVEVPSENLIGNEGEGFKQALKILEGGRIAIAGIALGLAEAALNLSIDYAKQRKAFGTTLSQFQGIQFYLADIATNVQAARLLIEHAAELYDRGMNARKEISMAKYFASQVAMDASRMAIQIYGGYGYFRDFGIERYLRDSKLMEIGEGTNEVQKMIISRELLK
ncbi:MAG: acyl-CoA dehydrogenase family protein [Thermoplasmata archaeon]|jgi:alkylation response protein AidB-like acyl-CoA dehydrogenase|nr:acyl-CoA dehydrogenase family protein [Thermoplasmata archaeon]